MGHPDTAESSPPKPHSPLAHAREEFVRRDPLWPEHLTVLAVILLSLTLPDDLTVGPPWLLPAVEGLLFLGLVASTPRAGGPEPRRRRKLRIGLVSLMSAGNVASLFFLARFSVSAHRVSGRELIGGGVVLGLIAVIVFALWYWEMDGGGPIRRASEEVDTRVDFVFPQMLDERWAPDGWMPRLPDFLYLSLVNAATFGPPESHFPLTGMAKLMLSLQSLSALATDTLIVARAVNILG
jgi:hypothetical protein